MPEFEIGFSPCPNDTFIFDALVNHKIDTKGYTFKVHLEDVQTLNEWAIAGKLPFSKISYGVWPLVKNNYTLLNSGGALGKGVGPLLVYKEDASRPEGKPEASTMRVAIPGVNTTAHLLFSLAFPNVTNKEFLVFNEIENAVLNGKVDAGVIIHENRFTYADKGLSKWMDLGTYFEETFNAPIPLGGIIARNDINANEIAIVDDLIKQSVEYAFANPKSGIDFIKQHAQEMDEAVMYKHIELYVNQYSVDLGIEGKKAIDTLFELASKNKVIPNYNLNLYVG